MYVYDSISPLLQYPGLEPVLDDLLPKKSALVLAKWFVILFFCFCNLSAVRMRYSPQFFYTITVFLIILSHIFDKHFFFLPYSQNHLNLVLVNDVPLFFNIRDGPYMPTLRLLHQCKVFSFLIDSSILSTLSLLL